VLIRWWWAVQHLFDRDGGGPARRVVLAAAINEFFTSAAVVHGVGHVLLGIIRAPTLWGFLADRRVLGAARSSVLLVLG
jgi:hypothetical protein